MAATHKARLSVASKVGFLVFLHVLAGRWSGQAPSS